MGFTVAEEERVRSLAGDVIGAYVRPIKWVAYFTGAVLAFFGISWQVLLAPDTKISILDWFVPAGYVSQRVSTELKEEQSRAGLIQMLFPEPVRRSTSLDQFPKIKDEELPERIWETVAEGNEQEYRQFIGKPDFLDAIRKEFSEEVTYLFFENPINRKNIVRQILDRGQHPQTAEINILERTRDGNVTSCGVRFDHTQHHVAIAIPRDSPREAYFWFDCPSSRFPRVEVEIAYEGRTLEKIRLVEVLRTHPKETLELRVSKKVAEQLRLPGWERYTVWGYGRVRVSSATFDG